MKKLLFFLLIIISAHCIGQTPSGSKVRYQGIWYLCKDTATLTVNDTASITYQCRDSSLYFKAQGYWRKFAFVTGAGFVQITDTAAMLSPYTRLQRFQDSLTVVQARIQTKVAYSDTAAMLANRLKISDTLTMLDGRLSSIVLNNTGVIHTTPTTFSRSSGVWTATQVLATQSAYTALARASGSGVPSFQSLDTLWIPNFFTKVRSLSTAGSGISYVNGIITNTGLVSYPGAGIAVSTGSAWGTSLTDNSANWNTAYNRSGTGLTFSASTFTFTKQDATTLTVAVPTFNQSTTGNAATVTTNANLTGMVTSVGNATTVVTNANLTGGVTSVGNAATVVTNANLTGEVTSLGNAATLSNTAVIGKVLTGYTSGAGTVAATDNILQAIQKLNGNTAALVTGVSSVNSLTGAVALTGTANRVTVSAANVFDISAAYVGQSSITTLGTIGTGVWNGTAIGIGYGGTGGTAGAILNQTGQQALSNFNISGNGTVNGNILVPFGNIQVGTIQSYALNSPLYLRANGGGYIALNFGPNNGSGGTKFYNGGTTQVAQVDSAGNIYGNLLTIQSTPNGLTSDSLLTILTTGVRKIASNSFLTASTGVTTFAGGTTGLTPAAATSGAITLAGTLAVGNGGTGATGATTINGTSITYGTTNTITAAAGTLTGTTLAAGVTASSLTSAAGGAFGTNAFNSTGYLALTGGTLSGALNGTSATFISSVQALSIGINGTPNDGGVPAYINANVNGLPVTTGTTQTYGALRLRGGDNAVLDFGVNSVNTWIQATDKSGLNNFYNILLNPRGGNVGIGTTNPASSLQVNSPTTSAAIALSSSVSLTSGSRGDYAWYNSSTSTVALIKATAITDNVGTQLEFYTRPVAGSLTLALTLASNQAATFTGALNVTNPNIANSGVNVRYDGANSKIGLGIANSNGFPYLGFNVNSAVGSDNGTYDLSSTATRFRMDNGAFKWETAASGIAGNAITWAQVMSSDINGNFTATKGTFNGGTASTSTTTGAVIVTGGLGVSGKIYTGNDITTTGSLLFTTSTTTNVGGHGYSSTSGMWIYGKAGSVSDFTLLNSAGGSVFTNPTGTTVTSHSGPVQLASYIVSGLPTCNAGATGQMVYVTDALTPGFLVTVVGGGTTKTQVSCNGTNWVAQ